MINPKRSQIINSLKALEAGKVDLSELKEKFTDPADMPWLFIKEEKTGEFVAHDATVHTPAKIKALAMSHNLCIRFQTSDNLGAMPDTNKIIKIVKNGAN